MKGILFVFLISCNFARDSYKSLIVNDLTKYSYFISGYTHEFHYQGTGFFVEKNSKKYLITSSQIFSPFNEDCQQLTKPEYWNLFLPDSGSNHRFTTVRFTLDTLKVNLKCKNTPNLVSIDFTNFLNNNIYNISLAQSNFSLPSILDSVCVYGFPRSITSNSYLAKGGFGKIFVNSGIINKSVIDSMSDFDSSIFFKIQKNEIIENNLDFSGAPVFYKGNKNDTWRFLGMFNKIDRENLEIEIRKLNL